MLSLLQKNKKTIGIFILLFLGTLPELVGIFHPGFFVSDDGSWMVIRLSAFYEALRQGQFPVRYLPRLNNGFGYPVADFLYPLFLYLGSFIHVFHVNFVTTVKLLFGITVVGSAFFCFLWLKKQFGNFAGLVGSLVYTLFPYHLWDITKRGSLGEVLAMAIIPFILWQIDSGSAIFTGLGIGLLILSHNTLALLFLPVAITYMMLKKKIKKGISALLFGFSFSAFFWIPALYDLQYTIFSKTIVSDFSQYFLSSNLYPLIGIISFVGILLALIAFLKKRESIPAFFLVVSLLSIVLTEKSSTLIWQIFHLGTYIQFPFRFLSITAIGVGFLSAYAMKHFKANQFGIIGVVLIVLVYISSWQFFIAKEYQYYPDTYYSTNQDSTTVQNEYMPIGVKKPYTSQQHSLVSATGIDSMENFIDKGSSMSFTIQTSRQTQVTIGKIFFPGWIVTVDNNPQKIQTNDYGFMVFTLPQGKHMVAVKFGETPIRMLADGISLIIFGILTILFFIKIKKHKT